MIDTTIAHYRITAKLGEGGMGEVYRATDTKLNRDVALKILPSNFSADEQRMSRFQREAEVLASLDHPNIGAIYGIEHAGDTHALVLQLIEGPTLAERIANGAIPLEEALSVALQIAEALEAAHEKGIVHRDLKPANVKITPEGQVKVLDFGLAKAIETERASSPDLTQSPTLTMAATQAGMILGTAGYMAPEQARGKTTDRRADIWAWGVVLFEMLSGARTFEGEDVSMVLAHVLSQDPDWGRLPPSVPTPIRSLIERCLRKDVSQRVQSIGDARIAVQEYLADPTSVEAIAGQQTAVAGRTTSQKAVRAGLVAALVAAAAFAGWALKPAPADRPLQTEAILPAEKPLMMMFGPGVVLSPDGSRLVYSTGEYRNPSGQLYVRRTDQLEASPLAGSEGGYNPFVSPDGDWIGFVTTGELKKVAFSGGAPLTLSPVARGRGASWGPDGTIVFAPNPASPLLQISAAGGEPQPLTKLADGENSHRWPQFLPGGRQLLFTSYSSTDVQSGEIQVADLDTGTITTVHRGATYGRYVETGHLLFWREGTVFGAPLDLDTLELTELPAPILQGVSGNSEGGAQFDVSANGTLVYLPGIAGGTVQATLGLAWVDARGDTVSASTVVGEFGERLALAPDQKRVAVVQRISDGTNIWIIDLERDTSTRLTFADGTDTFPRWSPDGRTLYFSSDRSGVYQVYRKPADGSAEAELLLDGEHTQFVTSVSNDEKLLLYTEVHPKTAADLWVLPLEGEPVPQLFLATPFVETNAVFSPDTKWIAYVSRESGRPEIYVRPYPGPGGRWQVSTNLGNDPHWSPDGRTLSYESSGEIMKVSVQVEGEALRLGRPERLSPALRPASQPGWDVSADGERVLILMDPGGGPSVEATGPIVVRLTFHWFEELRRRLGGK